MEADLRKGSLRKIQDIKRVALLFVGIFLVYVLTAGGRIDSGDGLTIFAVSQSLLEGNYAAIDPPAPNLEAFDAQGRSMGKAAELGIEDGSSIRGRNEKYYSPYGIGHSLLILPFLLIGQLFASIISLPPQWTMQFVSAMLFNPLVSAASGVIVYLVGCRLSYGRAKSIALAIIYAVGTMTWVYAKSFFSDPLIALLLIFTFYGLLSHRHTSKPVWLWLGGASLGLAILTKPASVINAPIFFAYLLYVNRSKPWPELIKYSAAFALPIALGLAGTLLYNWWRFESPLDTGYRNIGWNFPFWQGFYGLIASPGKGYLWYNPVVLAAIAGIFFSWRRHTAEWLVVIGIVLMNLLFLAKYDHWHGGGSWGPRLLLPLTPFVILPLGSLIGDTFKSRAVNLLLAFLIVISVMAQIPGVSVNFARYLQRVYSLSVDDYYRRVTFEVAYSPLIGQWLELREVVENVRNAERRRTISTLIRQDDAIMPNEQTMAALSANLPDFWFVYLGFIFFGDDSALEAQGNPRPSS